MSLIDQHREREALRVSLVRQGKYMDWLTLEREHPLPPVTIRYLVEQLPKENRPRIATFRGRVLLISTCSRRAILVWDHGHQSHDADVYRIERSKAYLDNDAEKASRLAICGLRLKIFPEKRFDLSDVDRDDREALTLLAQNLDTKHITIGRYTEHLPLAVTANEIIIATAHEAFLRGSNNKQSCQRTAFNRACWPQIHFKRSARKVEEL